MNDNILEFASLDNWVEQLLYLELHPEICSRESLEALTQLIHALGDTDPRSRVGNTYLLLRCGVESGIGETYKHVFVMRSSRSKGFEAWLHDYQMWEHDLRILQSAALRIPAMNRHVVCACRLALEFELVSEDQPDAMASALARWSHASLFLPETPTREEFGACLERLLRAEEIARRSDDSNLLSTVSYILGVARYRGFVWGYVADLELAIPPLQTALDRVDQATFRAAILVQLGQVLSLPPLRYDPKRLEEAIAHLKETLAIAEPSGDVGLQSTAHWTLGQAYHHRPVGRRPDNLEQSTYHYEQARGLNHVAGNELEEGRIALELAGVYLDMAATDQASGDKAKEIYSEWQQFFSKDRFRLEAAQIHHGLGLLYAPGDHHRSAQDQYLALEHYQKAQTLYTDLGRSDLLAPVLGAMGVLYTKASVGDRAASLMQALSCFRQALAIAGDHDPLVCGALLHDLGLVYIDLPSGDRFTNLETARQILTQALAIRTPDRFPLQYADTLEALAGVHAKLSPGGAGSSMRLAVREFREALRWRTQLDTPLNCASSKEKLATALLSLDSPAKRDNLLNSIKLFREAIQVFLENGDAFGYAHAHANMALAYIELCRLGMASKDDVVSAYREALGRYSQVTWPVERRKVLYELGVVYLREHDWQAAHKVFEEAIEITEMLYETAVTAYARHGEMAEALDLHSCDAYSLARIGRLEDAVERLENSRGRALVDTLRLRQAKLDGLEPAQRGVFLSTVQRIEELESEVGLQSIGQEGKSGRPYHEISYELGELRHQLEGFQRVLADPACKLDEIASLSDPAAPFVYLTITPAGSMAIIVPHEALSLAASHVVWMDSFDFELVKREFMGWYGGPSILLNLWNIETGDLAQPLSNFLTTLGRHLVAPLCQRITGLGYRRVRLIALQDLSSMPLHAARIGYEVWADEIVEFSYCPCARSGRWRRTEQGKARSLLAVAVTEHADTKGTSSSGTRLLFSVPEAETIAESFKQHSLLMDRAATTASTLQRLKLGYSHVHFSCHGAFVAHSALASVLALHGGNVLSLADVLDTGLGKTELVVLSACQSALADVRNAPDEIVGFPYGFLRAGAQGVIASLWRVRDDATAMLLRRFYRYHIDQEMPPAEALQRAQYWLRTSTAQELSLADWYDAAMQRANQDEREALAETKDHYSHHPEEKPYTHPFFWAGFIYIGL